MTKEEFLQLDVDFVVCDSEEEHFYVICEANVFGAPDEEKESFDYAARELDVPQPKHIRIDARNAESRELRGRIIRK